MKGHGKAVNGQGQGSMQDLPSHGMRGRDMSWRLQPAPELRRRACLWHASALLMRGRPLCIFIKTPAKVRGRCRRKTVPGVATPAVVSGEPMDAPTAPSGGARPAPTREMLSSASTRVLQRSTMYCRKPSSPNTTTTTTTTTTTSC